jgi:hypothetical protein
MTDRTATTEPGVTVVAGREIPQDLVDTYGLDAMRRLVAPTDADKAEQVEECKVNMAQTDEEIAAYLGCHVDHILVDMRRDLAASIVAKADDLLTRTCPTWCDRTHDEAPDEAMVCESAGTYLEQVQARPVLVQVSHVDGEARRLHLGDYEFDLSAVQALRRELGLAEQMLRAAQP